MGVFDIIGPVMIGPSSSHTAGAARLGKMAGTILGEVPVKAVITLYGSFAQTYKGHGTDKALVAGLMGFAADDERIKDALSLAEKSGLEVVFKSSQGDYHPNTAEFELSGVSGKKARVRGASLGGGSIRITSIDGYEVEFAGEYYTLITIHQDKPGVIANITQILAQQNVNIAFMRVSRKQKGAQALMILETDQPIALRAINAMNELSGIQSALVVQPI